MAKLSVYKVNNGINNMRLDLEVLERSISNKEKEPVIRFYGWLPECVSLGRNQSFNCVNIDYCNKNKIDIVKRITGGRALFHKDEITYLFVCPSSFLKNGDSVISSYKEVSSAITYGFKNLNIKLEIGNKKSADTKSQYCMLLSTGADLCFNGKKIIGSAQYRKQGYILQHGSVLISYDIEKTEKLFNEHSIENSITCIKEINNSLSEYDIINSMIKGFTDYFSISDNRILRYRI